MIRVALIVVRHRLPLSLLRVPGLRLQSTRWPASKYAFAVFCRHPVIQLASLPQFSYNSAYRSLLASPSLLLCRVGYWRPFFSDFGVRSFRSGCAAVFVPRRSPLPHRALVVVALLRGREHSAPVDHSVLPVLSCAVGLIDKEQKIHLDGISAFSFLSGLP